MLRTWMVVVVVVVVVVVETRVMRLAVVSGIRTRPASNKRASPAAENTAGGWMYATSSSWYDGGIRAPERLRRDYEQQLPRAPLSDHDNQAKPHPDPCVSVGSHPSCRGDIALTVRVNEPSAQLLPEAWAHSAVTTQSTRQERRQYHGTSDSR
ncbi:hypothetical protein B0J12DRAFT_696249 [Macrophomina phaseolina]|uniref:Secreted protein n=1 Tax=Macrophomina phaseolina TaxID=35725 RepID=A0ABQ8GN95_9PEZI|nr:hypothetical protein B0J12DRAFT_696249 [Macrophomina phaseolina]